MKMPNLSEWALKHQQMVVYLIIVLTVGGILSFFSLGRAEDPAFTFKVMVVRTIWPGATAQEVERELLRSMSGMSAISLRRALLRPAGRPLPKD